MIEFVSITAKNFLSIGKDPITIEFKEGLNVIIGENKDNNDRSNGSGKSSSMDAVFFSLFGKTMRELKKQSDVVNWKYKKDTECVLTFKKGKDMYKIIRTVSTSSLSFYKNGKDITRDKIPNTQKDIEDVVGLSEDVCKNSVIMGINQTTPFMAQSKTEKRKFTEGIFDMNIFFDMLKDVRKDYNEKIKELTALESETNEKEKSIAIYREQSEKFEDNKIEKINKLKDKIKTLKTSINDLEKSKEQVGSDILSELESSIKEIKSDIEKYEDMLTDKVAEKERNAAKKIDQNQYDIKRIKKSIDDSFVSGKCPTCQREMTESDTKHVKEEINKLESEIDSIKEQNNEDEDQLKKIYDTKKKLKSKIETLEDKKYELETNISDINKIIRSNEIVDNKIEDNNERISEYKNDIGDIKNEKNEIQDTLIKEETKLQSNKQDIEQISKDVDILDKLKFVFGENGVKSFIINKVIKTLNGRINHYLSKLNANCSLTFDEYFDETIVNHKKQECSYFNFSSGERRNIDIAIMLSFMDIQKIQGKFDTNIMIFDELIDGSLDAEGVQLVLDILTDKCNNGKYIYLITHRKEAKNYATNDVIEFVKRNGITTKVA